MKAKFLMMAAISATALGFASCSDDPSKDFPESEFTIRQLRLEITNNDNGTVGRSSENPVNGSTTINYPTVDAQGNPFLGASGGPVASKVTLTKPTDAIIATEGAEVLLEFLPGTKVNTADIVYFDGTTGTLPYDSVYTENDQQLSKVTTLKTFTLGDFKEGAVLQGQHILTENGSIYNYVGDLYVWHYHPVNLTVTNNTTGGKANTLRFNHELQAVVREQAIDKDGNPATDEDGNPVFIDESVLTVSPDDQLTLSYEPAFANDEIAISLPDGSTVVLNAQNKTYAWTANQFGTSSSISAVLTLTQANDIDYKVSASITVNAPEEE